jgi:hypothetical protein
MNIRRIATITGITAALGLGLGACGSSAPAGFNNAAALTSSVKAHTSGSGIGLQSEGRVTCTTPRPGWNTGICRFTYSDGSYTNLTVHVAANGQSWRINTVYGNWSAS